MYCKKLLLILTILGFFVLNRTFAQECPGFIKENCKSMIEGFLTNEQPNVDELSPGDSLNIGLNFYSNQLYRLAVCIDETIKSQTEYSLQSEDGLEIYNSTWQNKYVLDFELENSMELFLKVIVHEGVKSDAKGCVSVIRAFKYNNQ